MGKWNTLADVDIVKRTIDSLKQNNIDAYFVKTGDDARKKVLELIPESAEVMNMSSVTVDSIGLAKELNDSGRFNSIRKKLSSMDKNKQGAEMKRLGTAHEFAIGSVHAVTEDGRIIVASASGSQIPAYSYGAAKVIWVVGTQKIVKNLDEGMERVYKYVFPLEDARAKKVYGSGSGVNKMLIINKEMAPNRLILIFVNEVLGF